MFDEYKNKILGFYEAHRRMPSYREIADLLHFKSTNAVYRLVNKLIEAGVVTKDAQGKLIPNQLFDGLPLLGAVKAGLPSLAEESLFDVISLDNFLVRKKDETYLLEVDGDSMIDAHIKNGDLVIAERTNRAKDGDIVIAEVDGEWTMKYLRDKNGKRWLEPANKNFKPIYPEQSLNIGAIVKGVIRKY